MSSETQDPSGIDPWLIRLLLAAVLAFGSEVLLWTDPLGRDPLEWAALLLGYLLLGTLAVDILARHRVRDLFGLMTVAGVLGLLNALLLNPETTLFDIPRTLITRALGAHTLIALEMLFLFLLLTGGHRRYLKRVLIFGALIVGLAWGTWVRWAPSQADVTFETPTLPVMLLVAALGLTIIITLTGVIYRRKRLIRPQHVALSLAEGLILTVALAILLFVRVLQNAFDGSALVFVIILLVMCAAIFWLRRGTRLTIVLEHHLPVFPLRPIWFVIGIAILYWSGILAYSLPLIGNEAFNQVTVVVYGFIAYGLAWLPVVSLLLGVRAYIRQTQSNTL